MRFGVVCVICRNSGNTQFLWRKLVWKETIARKIRAWMPRHEGKFESTVHARAVQRKIKIIRNNESQAHPGPSSCTKRKLWRLCFKRRLLTYSGGLFEILREEDDWKRRENTRKQEIPIWRQRRRHPGTEKRLQSSFLFLLFLRFVDWWLFGRTCFVWPFNFVMN